MKTTCVYRGGGQKGLHATPTSYHPPPSSRVAREGRRNDHHVINSSPATAIAMNNSIFLRRHVINVRRSQVCCCSYAVVFQFSSILDNYRTAPAGRGILQLHYQQQKVSYSSLQREE